MFLVHRTAVVGCATLEVTARGFLTEFVGFSAGVRIGAGPAIFRNAVPGTDGLDFLEDIRGGSLVYSAGGGPPFRARAQRDGPVASGVEMSPRDRVRILHRPPL
jgi:hypothetical protein